MLLFCFRRGHFSHAQFWSKISEILLCNLKKGLKGQNSGQTFIITEVHIWQAFKRVKIKKSFVTRCTLIWPEFFLKVSCVFIFLLHDLIENPSKISEILLCNLKKGLKGQNSCHTVWIFEIAGTWIFIKDQWQFIYLFIVLILSVSFYYEVLSKYASDPEFNMYRFHLVERA